MEVLVVLEPGKCFRVGLIEPSRRGILEFFFLRYGFIEFRWL